MGIQSKRIAKAVLLAAVVPGLAAAQGDQDTVDEIVVTSQKIERSLQDTKESVAVIDANQIDAQRMIDLRDVFHQTANAFETFNNESFGIRGVTNNSASTGGGSGELGSLYIDNVAFFGFAARFGPKALWDVEQVEILRGPQSTNVGRNALIGAVAMTTRAPDPSEFDGAVRVEAGNFSTLGVEGMLNIPVSERAALRFTAETRETDGFNRNQTIPDSEYDGRSNQTFRGRFLIEATDRLSIGLMAQYAETERGQQIYRADLAPLESRTSSANLEAFENYDAFSAAIDISYEFSERVSLRSITSMLDGDYERFDDDDEGPDGGNAFRGRDVEDENVAQELRLDFTLDRVTGVAGIYYADVGFVNNTRALTNVALANLGVPAQLLPFYPPLLEVVGLIPAEQDTTNFAFFTEWEFQLGDAWRLSAGFRYDNEEQDFITNTNNALAPGSELPDPVAAGQAAEMQFPGLGPTVEAGVAAVNAQLLGLLAPTNNSREDTTYEAFLPQVGLTYEFSDNVSASFFYKRGYRVGGVDISLAGVRSDYDPEFLDNFELSLRSVFNEGRTVLNANAYFGDWSDQQVAVCPMGIFSCVTENAGESEISGAELELRHTFSDSLSAYVSVGLSDTEFTDFVSDISGDLTGNDFAFSPETTAAVGGQWWITDRIAVGGSVAYQSETWSDTANTVELDDRTLVDLNVRYETERFAIVAYGKNLTDEFYLISDGPGLDLNSRLVTAGFPRQYGATVQVNF
ncbi:MAG: TonB-dependent receptor [Pseudomonadota bacterium]